ncbi:DUF4842 domain-containing protein [Psychroflexus sediminis]|uniref:DUF4382 domain-containing protein n=1 Tax=Psychroflexus sediminis TaxID=470826 RepID=A0A1G7VX93_9FLAO|nr:DUF4842 domain-containing protein [Psychroflexus sediminis]SDG64426.1 hypothetical protein SAMN04488027_104236 [Psychroflexus sediminis]
MKNLFRTFNLFMACTAMMFMYSCQDEAAVPEEASGVEFIFSGDRVSTAKTGAKGLEKNGESCDLAFASYAVVEMAGNSYTIDLNTWGDDFKTDLIELPPGNYEVTSCQLYDADDNPLYATPMVGSEFEQFVNQPLPFSVTVENYRKIEYDIEVLCVEEFTPPQFGFVFWNIDLKETKNLCIFTNFCKPDEGHEVATLEAFVYPNENETSEADLIWSSSADGDYGSEVESNELLCLKLPYDPSISTAEQSVFIKLYVNDVLFEGTISLDRVDMINDEKGYLHLNENCDGDFDVFSNTYNVAWEDLNDDGGANDCDYNDFIVRTTSSTDIATGNLNFTFEPVARGGGYSHAFKMWLPGTGYVISGDATDIQEVSGNTMVEIYPSTNQAFNPNGNFVNSVCGGVVGSGIMKTITIESAPSDFVFYLLNPFDANLEINGGPNYNLTVGNLFPTSTFTKDGQQYPNGLITDQDWKWVQEGTDIRTVYGNNFQTNFVPTSNLQDLYENCP